VGRQVTSARGYVSGSEVKRGRKGHRWPSPLAAADALAPVRAGGAAPAAVTVEVAVAGCAEQDRREGRSGAPWCCAQTG
jgi:hypothetical protein